MILNRNQRGLETLNDDMPLGKKPEAIVHYGEQIVNGAKRYHPEAASGEMRSGTPMASTQPGSDYERLYRCQNNKKGKTG